MCCCWEFRGSLEDRIWEEIDEHDAVFRDNEALKYAKHVGLKQDFRLVVRGAARNMDAILNGSSDEVLIFKSVTHRDFKAMIEDEVEKTQFACILSYITHLINFRKVAESARWSTEAMSKFMIPRVVFHRFLILFLDPVSNVISSEKSELLICYILVLTLYADDFLTDSTDIENDLAITIRPYFLQLGCKAHWLGPFKKSKMTLPVPLVFQGLKKRRVRW